jgi:hypothetical protein
MITVRSAAEKGTVPGTVLTGTRNGGTSPRLSLPGAGRLEIVLPLVLPYRAPWKAAIQSASVSRSISTHPDDRANCFAPSEKRLLVTTIAALQR